MKGYFAELRDDRKAIADLRRDYWKQVCEYKASELEFDFEIINPSQYRISKGNQRIDLFPLSMKFHKIHSDVRGYVGSEPDDFIDSVFGKKFKNHVPGKGKKKKGKKSPHKGNGIKVLTMDSLMPVGKHKGLCMRDVPRPFLKYVYEQNYTTPDVMQFISAHYNELFN